MNKHFVTLTSTTLALALLLVIGLSSTGRPVSAKIIPPLTITAASTTIAATQTLTLPQRNIYALTTDNMIYVLAPGTVGFTAVGRVPRTNGNLIGIDFRVSNKALYGLTDRGKLLLIDLTTTPLGATVVSTLTPRFAGGFQSLFDFNPVVDAIRIMGSNDQNFAITSANGGTLNTTVVQTALAYAAGDVNAGINPNLTGGAYNNNVAGAANTIFYAIDYDLNTFVTIASKSATGSSNTGGGQLQTIGPIVDPTGNPINLNPVVDIDIFTDANRVNTLVGLNNETIFTISLSQINPNLALGTTQKVTAQRIPLTATPRADAFIDLAIQP
ncbi:MAG TPA: DUF4394 domain-containing protein [Blastocatellia bacterium]|nr:DUF4394 domain-containing protein [Blastocatellia bacterium]